MGQDVQEIVNLCVQVPCKVVSTANDIVLMMLRALADRHSRNAANKPLEAEARAKHPYYLGAGRIDPARFNQLEGNVEFLNVARSDLEDLEKAFKDFGLTWTTVKSKDDEILVMVHGREEVIEQALVSIAPKLGIPQQEINEAREIETGTPEYPNEKQACGLKWHKVTAAGSDVEAYTAINGSYDVIAAADGTWAIRQADKIIQSDQVAGGGLRAAMIYGNVAANNLANEKELMKDVKITNPTAGVPLPNQENTAVGLMEDAIKRSEAHNAQLPKQAPQIGGQKPAQIKR